MTENLPMPGTLWKHHSGRLYRVKLLANEHTEHPDRYPVTVVYEGMSNGRVWAKSLERFHKTMTRCEEDPLVVDHPLESYKGAYTLGEDCAYLDEDGRGYFGVAGPGQIRWCPEKQRHTILLKGMEDTPLPINLRLRRNR